MWPHPFVCSQICLHLFLNLSFFQHLPFINIGIIHLLFGMQYWIICTKSSYSSNLFLIYVKSKSLFLSNKSSKFDLLLFIFCFNSFTSITNYSLAFFMFNLLNSFCCTMFFICKIYTIILSIVYFLVSYFYNRSRFFPCKPSTLCLYFINVFWYAWFVLVHVSSFYFSFMHFFVNFENSISLCFISLFIVVHYNIFTLTFMSISFFYLFQVCIRCLYSSYPCCSFLICFSNPCFSSSTMVNIILNDLTPNLDYASLDSNSGKRWIKWWHFQKYKEKILFITFFNNNITLFSFYKWKV